MAQKVAAREDHFFVAMRSQRVVPSLEGVLGSLDEEGYRAVYMVAEALRGGDDPEAVNLLILTASRLLRQAGERMPEWAGEAVQSALQAADSADDAGCQLVHALSVQAWRETSRLILGDDEDD